MNIENKDLIEFEKLLKSETNEAFKAYQQAKKSYMTTMKFFIKRYISGEDDFKIFYKIAHQEALDCYENEGGSWAIDELVTLQWMVDDFRYWLEDGQFEVPEEGLQ